VGIGSIVRIAPNSLAVSIVLRPDDWDGTGVCREKSVICQARDGSHFKMQCASECCACEHPCCAVQGSTGECDLQNDSTENKSRLVRAALDEGVVSGGVVSGDVVREASACRDDCLSGICRRIAMSLERRTWGSWTRQFSTHILFSISLVLSFVLLGSEFVEAGQDLRERSLQHRSQGAVLNSLANPRANVTDSAGGRSADLQICPGRGPCVSFSGGPSSVDHVSGVHRF
jgi:hypothetical protein